MPASYTVHPGFLPDTSEQDAAWAGLPALNVAAFRPESSSHRPLTQLKLLNTPMALCGLFRVQDAFVRSRYTRFQDPVYRDSCVEFFLQPREGGGYFNLECNAGGCLRIFWITDPAREGDGFRACRVLSESEGNQIAVHSSLPAVVEPEQVGALVWYLRFSLPWALIESVSGAARPRPGECWRANAYKCGDETSQPHWAAWSPVPALNFHDPASFGHLLFA